MTLHLICINWQIMNFRICTAFIMLLETLNLCGMDIPCYLLKANSCLERLYKTIVRFILVFHEFLLTTLFLISHLHVLWWISLFSCLYFQTTVIQELIYNLTCLAVTYAFFYFPPHTHTHQYVFMSWCLVMCRDNFTFRTCHYKMLTVF
jgi:hypothetical protein